MILETTDCAPSVVGSINSLLTDRWQHVCKFMFLYRKKTNHFKHLGICLCVCYILLTSVASIWYFENLDYLFFSFTRENRTQSKLKSAPYFRWLSCILTPSILQERYSSTPPKTLNPLSMMILLLVMMVLLVEIRECRLINGREEYSYGSLI